MKPDNIYRKIIEINHLGAFRYKYTAMIAYNIFGIQTETMGGVLPFTVKVEDTVWNRMYEKLRAKPTPKFIPIPPLTYLEDKDNPMEVRIKAANDMAMRW